MSDIHAMGETNCQEKRQHIKFDWCAGVCLVEVMVKIRIPEDSMGIHMSELDTLPPGRRALVGCWRAHDVEHICHTNIL